MRKIILLMTGLLFIGFTFGQKSIQSNSSVKQQMDMGIKKQAHKTHQQEAPTFNNRAEKIEYEMSLNQGKVLNKRNFTHGSSNVKGGKVNYISETFDTEIPADWTTVNNGDGNGWLYDATNAMPFIDSDAAGSGTHEAGELQSPIVDVSSASALTLVFDHYYNNIGSDWAEVDVWDGSAWQNVASYAEDHGTGTGDMENVEIDVSAYANADFQVRFNYDDANSWAWYWYVDNVVVYEPAPYQFTYLAETSGLVRAGNSYQYMVKLTNNGTNDDTYDLTSSGGSWTYDILDKAGNSTSSISINAGQVDTFYVEVTVDPTASNFDTDVENVVITSQGDNTVTDNFDITTTALSEYALFEDFEAGLCPPNDDWTEIGSWSTTTSSQYEGGYGAYAYGGDDTLITPLLDIEDGDILSFYGKNSSWSGGTMDILISDDMETWTSVLGLITPAGNLTGSYQNFEATFTSAEAGIKYVAFVNSTDYFYLDYIVGPEIWYPNNDAAMQAINQPLNNFLGGSDLDIEVEIKNKGLNNLTSVDVVWDVVEKTGMTSISSGTYNWTGDLATEESEILDITTFTSVNDTLLVEIYVENPNGNPDENNLNDTLSMEISPAMVITGFPDTTDFENSGDIPLGWFNNENDDGDWQFVTSMGHGASNDHTTGSGYFAGIDDSSPNDEGDEFILESPYYDLANSGLALPLLEFWYMNTDAAAQPQSQLYVEGWDGTQWVEIDYIDYAIEEWTEFKYNLSDYLSQDDFKLRFRAITTSNFYSDPSLDDVRIYEPAALDAALTDIMQPTTQFYPGKDLDIEVELYNNGSTNLTSADIVWNVVENTNMTSIASGTYSWTGDLAFNTSEAVNIGPFTSINDTLMVEVYVDNPNGGTDELADNDTVSVEILPATVVASFPDTVDFENGGDIPLGWFNNQDDDGDWEFVTNMGHGASGDHTTGSGYFAGVDDSSPNGEGDELILTSPYLDLANSGLVLPLLKFWYMNTDDATKPQSQLYVEGWDGTQWFEIDVIDYAIEAWTEFEYNLVDYVSQDDFKIRFRAVTTSDYYSDPSLDDIMIYQPEPEDAAVTAITYPAMNPISSGDWAIRAEIMNNGYNNLTSLTLNWETDDGTGVVVQTPYSWTGDLAYGESEVVELVSDFTFNTGSYDITVYSEAPNGETDPNNDNDTATASYDVIGAGQVVEDFEGSTFLPAGWSETNNASAWVHSEPGDWYTLNGRSATLFHDVNSPEEKLIMPKMTVDGNDSLVFYIRGGNGTFGFGYSKVVLKYTADTTGGGTWTDVGDTIHLDFDAGTRYVRDLSAIASGDYFFAFSCTSTFDYTGYNSATVVDDIMGPVKAGIDNNDLSVEEVTYSSDFKAPGEMVAINAKIKNVGLVAQTGVVAKLSIDGTVQNDSIILPTLHYNEPANISFDWTAEAGVHEFEVFIEADENTANDSYTVQDVIPMAGQIAEGFEGSDTEFPYKWQAPAAEWDIGSDFFIGTYENTNIAYAYSAGSDGEILVTPTVEISDAVTDDISFYAAGGNLTVGDVKLQMLLMAEGDSTWQKVGDTLNIDHDYFKFYSFNLDTASEGRYNIGFSFSGVTDGTYGSALGIDHVVGPYVVDSIDFVVTDSAMMPIANAMIEFDGQQLYTDSSGMADYTSTYGMYDYTVTKTGYEVYNDTLLLNGDMVETIVLMPTNPMAIDVVPDSNEINVGVQPVITCEFDQPISEDDFTGIVLEEVGVGTVAGISSEVLADGFTVKISTPQLSWAGDYTVTIPSNTVINNYGMSNEPVTWSFETRDVSTPIPAAYSPDAGATDLLLPIGDITCQFDQNVSPTTTGALDNVTLEDDGGNQITGLTTTLVDGNTVSIQHPALSYNTMYTVSIPSNTVTNGYIVNDPVSWNFTTRMTTQPLVETLTPADGAIDVAIPTDINCEFDQTISATTANSLDNITVSEGGTPLTGVTATINDSIVNIAHPTLTHNTTYTVTIPSGTVSNVYGTFSNTETVWTFTTEPIFTVTFVVTDNATTDPIAGAEVDIDGNILTTDASGEATIDLVNGTYTYDVTATNYDPVSSSVTVSGAPVTEAVGMDETQYTVTFVVTDNATTDPIAGAEVDIDGNILTTNASGEATIDLINGTYTYDVTATDYDPVSGDVTVSSAPVTENVGMDETEYTVTFVVTDNATTDPIAGAEVDIDGNILTTDGNGEATIDLINGTYTYDVTATGYDPASGDVTVSSAPVTENVGMDETQYTVTFVVTDNITTDPIVGAEVDIDGNILTTDANGEATIDLINGDYDYSVTSTGYDAASGTVTVSSAAVTEEVGMDPSTYTVTFAVSNNETSEPISGAEVSVDGEILTTDNNGEATIDLTNGDYDYTVTAEDYLDATGTVTVDGAAVTEAVELDPDGISALEKAGIKVYPNPTNGEFNISVDTRYQLSVMDMAGKVVYGQDLQDDVNEVDISSLPSGMYIIELRNSETIHTLRILKK